VTGDGFGSVSPILWFYVSPPPPHENASGSLYIGVFLGQPHESEIKTDDIGASRWKQD
jgi:hypothetical protein